LLQIDLKEMLPIRARTNTDFRLRPLRTFRGGGEVFDV